MTRVLTIMGSGETSPTMVTPHQRTFARLGQDVRAVLLDSPYGFQENADELTEKTQTYFRESVGREVDAVAFRAAPASDAVEHAEQMARLRAADWVFAGPGSPSYALRTWAGSAVPEALHALLRQGGAVTFASAAALTLGALTVPVYEIYKVGEQPRWLEGLDVLGRATGVRAAVVPHFNNTEGGTHDTRFCYLGDRRLRQLEQELPEGTFVLGVDEHTGLVIDLDSGVCDVVGRGVVSVRVHGETWTVANGSSTSLDEIAARGDSERAPASPEAVASPGDVAPDDVISAIESGDVAGALALLAELDRAALGGDQRETVRSLLARTAASLGERVDVTETVRPYVDLLLALRDRARADKRWADSDTIRDGLAAAGLEVRDTPDGTAWEVRR